LTTQDRPLLSATEAKQRLLHIIEQFFSWKLQAGGGKTVSRLLLKSPPGLGKTREALDWAAQYQTDRERRTGGFGPRRVGELLDLMGRAAVFVPRHALAVEVKKVVERSLTELGRAVEVPILRGRDHDAEKGRAPCKRWQEARTLGEKGLPVYSNLCQRRRGKDTSDCPHFRDCEYIRSWRGARDARFVILVHAYLGLGWDSDSYARLSARFDLVSDLK
jgi:Rad3-related DNA helicase